MVESGAKNEFVSDAGVMDSYGKGWSVALQNFWSLVAVTLILGVIEMLGRGMGYVSSMAYLLPVMVAFLVSAPLGMGANWVYLKAARKDKFVVSDMFAIFHRNYGNAILAAILTAIFVIIGFVFLIIPGIIIAIRLAFVGLLIVDKKMEAMQAIRTSWNMTRGYSWTIFGFILLSIPIMIAGFLVFIVGALFSFVWIGSAFAVLYNSIEAKTGVKGKK